MFSPWLKFTLEVISAAAIFAYVTYLARGGLTFVQRLLLLVLLVLYTAAVKLP